jgi:hypothetical protein
MGHQLKRIAMPDDGQKGFDKLNQIFKQIDRKDTLRIALRLHKRILKRAFPLKGRARGSDGRGFPNLDPVYKNYKAGRTPYQTEITKQRAMTRRRNTGGSPIKGPRAEGRRLGPRKPLPNNQLSGQTMLKFQVKSVSRESAKLFFVGRGNVGAALEKRKPWIRPTNDEFEGARTDLSKVINKITGDLPKDLIRFDLGTITMGK